MGVFDSGVGGLSVLREIRSLLPSEDLAYVADSRHCPYGGKPYAAIRERAGAITRFLLEEADAKLVVVACNTATVAAVEWLRESFAAPFVGMEPAVKPAAAATRTGTVGVLATGATLGGERFARLVERFADGLEVLTQPCPGLVERVEAGDLDGPGTEGLLRNYLEPLLGRGVDTIVLGCTHYPFLRPTIERQAGPNVTLIDTGAAVARQVARVLDAGALRAPQGRHGSEQFFTTGDLATVGPVVSRLWGAEAEVRPIAI